MIDGSLSARLSVLAAKSEDYATALQHLIAATQIGLFDNGLKNSKIKGGKIAWSNIFRN